MSMPNFLILGAAKAGTTAISSYLDQHPEIYLCPVKETNFFALDGRPADFRGPGDEAINSASVSAHEDYEAQFAGSGEAKAVGEASPLYLYSSEAPVRIAEALPGVKLIAILRNPVERAYSSYLHMLRDGREPAADFAAALRDEERRIRENWEFLWHYRAVGMYATQLARYYERFPREQISVYVFDDFRKDATAVIRDICRFLGIDDSFEPDMSVRPNVTGIPRSKWLHKLLATPNPVKAFLQPRLPGSLRRLATNAKMRNLRKPEMSPDVRRELIEAYREEIGRLGDTLGRNLSHWLA